MLELSFKSEREDSPEWLEIHNCKPFLVNALREIRDYLIVCGAGGGGGQEILQAAAFPGRHFHGRPGSSRGHAVFRPSPWYSSVFLGAEVCTELLLHAESSAILRSTRKLLGVVEMFLILTVVVAASQMYRVQQK